MGQVCVQSMLSKFLILFFSSGYTDIIFSRPGRVLGLRDHIWFMPYSGSARQFEPCSVLLATCTDMSKMIPGMFFIYGFSSFLLRFPEIYVVHYSRIMSCSSYTK
jgi:hypothetical protein